MPVAQITAEPVAHLRVGAEDAVPIHLRGQRGLHRAQLDAALLRHRGNARGQAAAQGHQHVLDRGDSLVLRGELQT
jgi:hypothetical protein